jgi:preprotein translocase subunit SecA
MAALYQTEITATELREDLGEISREGLTEEFQADAGDEYVAKEEEFGPDLMRELERFIVLQVASECCALAR